MMSAKGKARKRKKGSRPRKRVYPLAKDSGSFKYWLEELRAPFFTATIVPVFLGGAISWSNLGTLDPLLFFLTLGGVLCLHAGTNVANDYFDHVSGNDEANKDFIRPFTGGSRLIQKGLLEPGSVLRVALGFMVVGALIGFIILLLTDWAPWILVFGVIGVFSGYFYTAPPIRLADRGLGEVFVGLNFGVLVVVGTTYVQTQLITIESIVASLPVAFLITLILYLNQFPDYRADKSVGKNNIVVRLGRKKAVNGYKVLSLATYGSILFGVAMDILPQMTLLALVTAPMTIVSARELGTRFDDPKELAPTCGRTVGVHLITGLLMVIAYLIHIFVLGGTNPL